MSTSAAIAGVFLLAYAGFATLAHARDRHYRQLYPDRPLPGRVMRTGLHLVGWSLLAVSFWLGMLVWGTAIGAVAWFGVASVTAGLLIWMLPYRPRWVVPVAVYGALASLLLLA